MDSEMEPTPLTKHKRDPAWKHCQMFKSGEKVQLKCNYCKKVFKGGGIHRMKEHLAGQRTNASTCPCSPTEVSLLMQQSLGGEDGKRKRRKVPKEEVNGGGEVVAYGGNLLEHEGFPNGFDEGYGMEVPITYEYENTQGFLGDREDVFVERIGDKNRRGRVGTSFGSPVLDTPGVNYSLGTISNVAGLLTGMRSSTSQVNLAIGRFLYDVGLPPHAVKSVYFQQMVDAIASQGPGYVGPSYHNLRVSVLKNSLDQVKTEINGLMRTLGRTGCSILVDQFDTAEGRIFINIFVSCPERTMFLKAVDVTEIITSEAAFFELLKGVVEEVGPGNVVQVITNGMDHYIAAGRRLAELYRTVLWNTCAAQCIQLILEDFGKIEWINGVLDKAKSITRFIYNSSAILNMMRSHTDGRDLVVLGHSSAETDFASLRCLVDLRPNLDALFTSQQLDFKSSMELSVFDQSFWSAGAQVTALTDPLLRLLRIVNSDRRPAMGYVHAGIYRAKEAIKKLFVNGEDYSMYWNTIDSRWESQWQNPLPAAGFYLNPKFFYSLTGEVHNNIKSRMFDYIEKSVGDHKIQGQVMKELTPYQNATGDFGRKMAIRAKDTLLPAEWWSTYGGGCPNLARLALRVLNQTCSLTGCRRYCVPFDQLHSTRNSIEHQRLSDMVYVTYNLRLGQPAEKNQDPLAPENINVVQEWVSPSEKSLDENLHDAADWVKVEASSGDSYNSGLAPDDFGDLGEGFDDPKILLTAKHNKVDIVDLTDP